MGFNYSINVVSYPQQAYSVSSSFCFKENWLISQIGFKISSTVSRIGAFHRCGHEGQASRGDRPLKAACKANKAQWTAQSVKRRVFVLIGKINDRNRQKLLVTIREVKGTKMIDLRVHQTGDDGELVATPAGVSLTFDQAERAIELLGEAKKRIAEQQ